MVAGMHRNSEELCKSLKGLWEARQVKTELTNYSAAVWLGNCRTIIVLIIDMVQITIRY